jgi:hypothetical protein
VKLDFGQGIFLLMIITFCQLNRGSRIFNLENWNLLILTGVLKVTAELKQTWVNSMKKTLIKEPVLFFSDKDTAIDSKLGLLNFGPYGKFSNSKKDFVSIKAGLISTRKSKRDLDAWLERMKLRILGKEREDTNERDVDFPGLNKDSPLGFEIVIDPDCVIFIEPAELKKIADISDRKARILQAMSLYEQKIKDLSETCDPSPNILFLPIPEEILGVCKDERFGTDKIVYERRTLDKSNYSEEIIPFFDFRNAIKVLAYKYGKLTCQLIKPSTLNSGRSVQDPATVAWNFSVATYYKATGIPWKISDIDDDTCYVGLSFYQEIKGAEKNLRASMAHVYLKTGESQVIRGKPFKWNQEAGKSPTLSKELASEIARDVIELYIRQKQRNPSRLVIHKASPFSESELEGFNEASKDIECCDFIHIRDFSGIQFYPKGSNYPAIRGTFLFDDKQGVLYTSGYVPYLDTYMGSSAPSPLFLDFARADSPRELIAKDILALTKLDWNNANFNSRLPVTISVSRKVGTVLSESSALDVAMPSQYMYYM